MVAWYCVPFSFDGVSVGLHARIVVAALGETCTESRVGT